MYTTLNIERLREFVADQNALFILLGGEDLRENEVTQIDKCLGRKILVDRRAMEKYHGEDTAVFWWSENKNVGHIHCEHKGDYEMSHLAEAIRLIMSTIKNRSLILIGLPTAFTSERNKCREDLQRWFGGSNTIHDVKLLIDEAD